MLNTNEKVTKELIKTTDALRKKYRALKIGRAAFETQIEESLKPITKPLNELLNKSKHEKDHHQDNIVKSLISPEKKLVSEEKSKQQQQKYKLDLVKKKLFNDDFITPDTSTFENSLLSIPKRNTSEKNQSELLQLTEQMQKNEINQLPHEYKELLINNSKDLDKTYGVYFKNGKYHIGNEELCVLDKNIKIKNRIFEGTRGLYELLLKNKPNESIYTDTDLKNYKTILNDTNACRIGYDPEKRIRGNRGHKYKKIIKKLFQSPYSVRKPSPPTPSTPYSTPITHSGSGLMQMSHSQKEYIYWDDPNELVERIRLLIASQQAGHSNHSNEIVSIIEELRESNIIQ